MKRRYKIISFAVSAVFLLSGTALAAEEAGGAGLGLNADTKPATQFTIDANEQVYALLDFGDEKELENAQRGLIAAPASLEIVTQDGKVAWSSWPTRRKAESGAMPICALHRNCGLAPMQTRQPGLPQPPAQG